jgi:hypothetical protein
LGPPLGWYHHIIVVMPKSLLRCSNPRFFSSIHYLVVWIIRVLKHQGSTLFLYNSLRATIPLIILKDKIFIHSTHVTIIAKENILPWHPMSATWISTWYLKYRVFVFLF